MAQLAKDEQINRADLLETEAFPTITHKETEQIYHSL